MSTSGLVKPQKSDCAARPMGADLTMDALLNRRYSSSQAPELLIENLLGILLAGGLDPQEAAWACDIFVLLLMTGVVGAG